VHPIELRQVLCELVIRASAAIRPGGGRIAIDTGEIWADAALLEAGRGAPNLREGRYASLCVSSPGAAPGADGVVALGTVHRHGGWIGRRGAPDRPGGQIQVLFPIAA
jgi:hypothetical protein